MRVALFDFDGTLTCRDSLIPFLRMVKGRPCFLLAMFLASPYLAAYALRLIQNDMAKEALLRHAVGGLSIATLREIGDQFARCVVPTLLREDMLIKLHAHQREGHCCVLVSASLDIYLEPWAKNAGFDYCIATSLAVNSKGLVNGKLEGGNCHGQEKARRVRLLLEEIGVPAHIYAYGDTKGDIPMLELANEGYWVKSGWLKLVRFKN